MQNNGGGDCFFLAISDTGNNPEIVEPYRKYLAEQLTDNGFHKLQETLYLPDVNDGEFDNYKKNIKSEFFEDLKNVYPISFNNYSNAEDAKTNLTREEYGYIKNPETLFMRDITQFKKHILKSEFWADDWAIGLIHNYTNTNYIIFSKTKDEPDNNKFKLTINVKFVNVTYTNYILLYYDNIHYERITYKDNLVFIHDTLPGIVKTELYKRREIIN